MKSREIRHTYPRHRQLTGISMRLTLICRERLGTPTPYRNVCRGDSCAQPLGIIAAPEASNKKGGQKTTFSIFFPTETVGMNIP